MATVGPQGAQTYGDGGLRGGGGGGWLEKARRTFLGCGSPVLLRTGV